MCVCVNKNDVGKTNYRGCQGVNCWLTGGKVANSPPISEDPGGSQTLAVFFVSAVKF